MSAKEHVAIGEARSIWRFCARSNIQLAAIRAVEIASVTAAPVKDSKNVLAKKLTTHAKSSVIKLTSISRNDIT